MPPPSKAAKADVAAIAAKGKAEAALKASQAQKMTVRALKVLRSKENAGKEN